MTLKIQAGFIAILAAALTGCAARTPHENMGTPINRSYVDLEPGWRIRVVTPILKSGTFKVQTEQVRNSAGMIELKTSDDFTGFEIDYYAVNALNRHRPFIEFSSAVATRNGKRTKPSQPLFPLFDLPATVHYVRLLFLTRVSQNEHDQAILAASSVAELDALTRRVEPSPAENCKPQPEGICSWVPDGISVQPEKRTHASRETWVPAT
ncbi:MAG: hypothetical protein AUG89_08130 [Acidobacteria bacterium 13_1_20CM_4_56_7]|nr:MAG: hypothetical protein AUG89_08130 [Acidobacteria bacterium 13_1_20CM_4_56_7]